MLNNNLGLSYLKKLQDEALPVTNHYIRHMIDMGSQKNSVQHEEDDEIVANEPLRMVVCMSKEGSMCLLNAHYVQSDIGFKRVVGFHEFELASHDRNANTSVWAPASESLSLFYVANPTSGVIFCRIYLNRQTAVAHQLLFQKIEEIVISDTGEHLKWRHIHAKSPTEYVGIVHWTADQHRGQAKGERHSTTFIFLCSFESRLRSWPTS